MESFIKPKYVNLDLINQDIANLEQRINEAQGSIEHRVNEFRTQIEAEVAEQTLEARTELLSLCEVRDLVTPKPVEVVEEVQG